MTRIEKRAQTAALEAVIDETRLLFHRLSRVAAELHRQGDLTGGRRGVLRSLYQMGPQTVPQLARARPVSRQHIQTLVNPLADEGLVELLDNPAHARSKLVNLTDRGRRLLEDMLERERKALGLLVAEVDGLDFERLAGDLQRLRELLTRPSIKQALEELAQ